MLTTIASSAPYFSTTSSQFRPHRLRRADDGPSLRTRLLSRAVIGCEELDRAPGEGTAISWPRRSSVNVIRPLAASRSASSSVSAQITQTADGDRGSQPGVFVFGEALAVERGDLRALGVDEVGERVGQPQLGGPERALRGGAEQPRLGLLRAARKRLRQAREGVVRGQLVLEVAQQLGELLGEVVGRGLAPVALQGEGGERVGAGGAAQREVDACRETGRRAG